MRIQTEILIDKYRDRLFAAAFSVCRNAEDADDVVRETDENGDWIGGYSAKASLNSDGKGPEWLEAGKAELGISW